MEGGEDAGDKGNEDCGGVGSCSAAETRARKLGVGRVRGGEVWMGRAATIPVADKAAGCWRPGGEGGGRGL